MQTVSLKQEANPRLKLIVQRRIVTISILLFAGKLVAYFLTNSVGILTDALESTVNVVTGFISVYAIALALKPKDKEHPFGHGKVEFLSASIEGFLIMLAGGIIIFEAVKRLFSPSMPESLDVGIVIIAAAGLLNYLAGWYSISVGKKNNSIALVSGGKHLQSDTYSSIGLVIGLILLYITKITWLDSAIALIFGSIIIYTGFKILKETTSSLMDEADFKMIEEIKNILVKNKSEKWIDIHNFKIVKYGNSFHIDCDLTLPWYFNITQAHAEGEVLKNIFIDNFSKDIVFMVHTDSCMPENCKNCKISDCLHRKEEFESEIELTFESLIKEKDKQ